MICTALLYLYLIIFALSDNISTRNDNSYYLPMEYMPNLTKTDRRKDLFNNSLGQTDARTYIIIHWVSFNDCMRLFLDIHNTFLNELMHTHFVNLI